MSAPYRGEDEAMRARAVEVRRQLELLGPTKEKAVARLERARARLDELTSVPRPSYARAFLWSALAGVLVGCAVALMP